MSLELLRIVAFGGALLTYVLGKISAKARDCFAVCVSLALVILIACLYGKSSERVFYSGFLGLPLILRTDMLSWLFAITIAGVGRPDGCSHKVIALTRPVTGACR
jgi:formate hydrogenlyase subunit 3/multisubunit Na+/H+ antiporter MnhD subunit